MYNDLNELVCEPSNVTISSSGSALRRSFNDGKVVSVKDEAGAEARFYYDQQDSLVTIQIGRKVAGHWQLGYDSKGRLNVFRDPSLHTTVFYYDEHGRVIRTSGSNGESSLFDFDDQGRLRSATDHKARLWTIDYDQRDRLHRITGPGGEWKYQYARGMLLAIRGPAGYFRIKPRKHTLTLEGSAQNGLGQEIVFDRDWRLKRYRIRGANRSRLLYTEAADNFRVQNESGVTRYCFNKDETSLVITFENS